MKRGLAALGLCALLAACGSAQDTTLARTALETVRGAGARGGTEIRSRLTREVLDEYGKPLILADIPARRTQANLQPIGRNGDAVTWVSGDGAAFTFHSGVLVATRGLGDDLISADAAGTIAALARGGGGAERRVFRLDGVYGEIGSRFDCRIAQDGAEVLDIIDARRETIRFTETCSGPDGSFTNLFWRGRDGTMWKSRQHVSPGLGAITFERLVK